MTDLNDTATWILRWFQERGPMPGDSMDKQLAVNYFDEALVDSMGVVELIASIEDHFGIRFGQEHFEDRRIMTIGGLTDIVQQLRTEKE